MQEPDFFSLIQDSEDFDMPTPLATITTFANNATRSYIQSPRKHAIVIFAVEASLERSWREGLEKVREEPGSCFTEKDYWSFPTIQGESLAHILAYHRHN